MDYPILLTPDGKYEAILQNAYSIMVEDEMLTTSSGYETLTFLLSNHDRKRRLLGNERMIEVQGRRYVIRVIDDLKNNSNVCTVTCDALWYDLNDGELKRLMWADSETDKSIHCENAVAQQLRGTGWSLGTVDVPGYRPVHTSEAIETSLYNLRQIAGNFGGDLFFDTKKMEVSLLEHLGIRHQKVFRYEKNTTSIKRTVDTRNLFTRFTLIGKDADGNDVTVEDINGGKAYVENYDWYDWAGLPRKIKWYTKTDDRWSNKENMLEYMNTWLETYSKPIVSYELAVSLFEVSPNLGDYVYVYDKDLDIGNWLRVVSRKKNVLQPHLSTVQLESTKRTIVESMVSTTTTSQTVQDVLTGVVTPDLQLKLPAGTEDWIMQYKDGKWKAQPIIGSILPEGNAEHILKFEDGVWKSKPILGSVLPNGTAGKVLGFENGAWASKSVEGFVLPSGTKSYIMQYVDNKWSAVPIIGSVLPEGKNNQILRMKNGAWVAETPEWSKLPTGAEGQVLQFMDGEWKATNVIGDINSILDELNGEVL